VKSLGEREDVLNSDTSKEGMTFANTKPKAFEPNLGGKGPRDNTSDKQRGVKDVTIVGRDMEPRRAFM